MEGGIADMACTKNALSVLIEMLGVLIEHQEVPYLHGTCWNSFVQAGSRRKKLASLKA